MHIVVCVKQVPDTTEVKVNPETGTLIRTGVPSIINPCDHFAIGTALELKKEHGGDVTVISMGPPQAKSVIQMGLALGADKGVLLSDMAFAGSDTWATSYTLARAVKKLGKADLILCGFQAIDGDTAQTGPGTAQQLHIPQITFCETIKVSARKVTVRRLIDNGYEIVEAKMPVLCTMVMPHEAVVRYPSFTGILKALEKPYEVWNAQDIGADPECIGMKGSPTQVSRIYAPPAREKGTMLTGTSGELAEKLLKILKQENFLPC
ncbi:MAG: electron transfer flavoprotein subunit beta/FixA family protein [bacterium]